MKLHKVVRAKKLTISFLRRTVASAARIVFYWSWPFSSYKYPGIGDELSRGYRLFNKKRPIYYYNNVFSFSLSLSLTKSLFCFSVIFFVPVLVPLFVFFPLSLCVTLSVAQKSIFLFLTLFFSFSSPPFVHLSSLIRTGCL